MKLRFIIAAVASLTLSDAATAAEIKVLAAGATKETILELIPQFEKSSGHKIVATWTGTANIKKRIAEGEVYDLVVVGGPEIDAFIKQGKLVSGSRVDLMKSGVGVAIRAGTPKPNIRSTEELKKALLAAKSIGYSTGPSGVYISNLFERIGITSEVKAKLKQVPSGVAVGSIIANGEAEIGFQQVSEFIHYPGIDYIGPLPAEVQHVTVYSAGIHSGAKDTEPVKALMKFLGSPAAAAVIKYHGMEPG